MFLARFVGVDELDHLDLIELVDALDTAHIPTSGDLLTPETRRIGHVVDRKLRFLQNLVPVHIRHRHLGGGYEPLVFLCVAEKMLGKLWQVTGADKRLGEH